MRFHPIILGAGAFLLIAAQDTPNPPAEAATFSEAFAEQSNAAEAAQAADALAEPATEPAEGAADSTEAGTESAAGASDAAEPQPEAEAVSADAAEQVAEAVDAIPAESPAAPSIPAKGEPPTREFVVGIWAEPGKKCETALDFKADGTLIGPFPRWELTEQGVLTMVGNRQKIWLTVVDKDTMHSRRSETDPPRKLTRCPSAAAASTSDRPRSDRGEIGR